MFYVGSTSTQQASAKCGPSIPFSFPCAQCPAQKSVHKCLPGRSPYKYFNRILPHSRIMQLHFRGSAIQKTLTTFKAIVKAMRKTTSGGHCFLLLAVRLCPALYIYQLTEPHNHPALQEKSAEQEAWIQTPNHQYMLGKVICYSWPISDIRETCSRIPMKFLQAKEPKDSSIPLGKGKFITYDSSVMRNP